MRILLIQGERIVGGNLEKHAYKILERSLQSLLKSATIE